MNNCHPNAACKNTGGGFTCTCNDGFTGNGTSCAPFIPLKSCKQIKEDFPESQDGVYTIRLEGTSENIQVWCEMTTDGGGWTLVWSYTFTNYDDFEFGSNAVTPYIDDSSFSPQVNTSSTAPLGLWPTHTGAMTFLDWKLIGKEMLFINSITNWYQCSPDTGNIIDLTDGTISCSIAKKLSNNICTLVPKNLAISEEGIALTNGEDGIIYLDNEIDLEYPVHNPCGHSSIFQPQSVGDPGGALLLRLIK